MVLTCDVLSTAQFCCLGLNHVRIWEFSLRIVPLSGVDHAAALLQVVMWEAASMALMYVAYVCVTFWVSRHDDPLQADVALHEVPQDEGVGESHMQRNHRVACCYGPCLTAACACRTRVQQQRTIQSITCVSSKF
jgi:hypothetical protein